MKNFDDTTLNILDHAVKLEIFNGDFYAEASKICSNKENSDIFKALSNIEYMHARIHQRLGDLSVYLKSPNLIIQSIRTKIMIYLTKLKYVKFMQ